MSVYGEWRAWMNEWSAREYWAQKYVAYASVNDSVHMADEYGIGTLRVSFFAAEEPSNAWISVQVWDRMWNEWQKSVAVDEQAWN